MSFPATARAEHPLLEKIWSPSFKTYTVNDGLSQSYAAIITQDVEGFIWLSTGAGIDRFNGYEFESISFQAVNERNPHLQVVALFINLHKQVSVVTRHGSYYVFDPTQHQFVPLYSSKRNLHVNNAQLLNDGQLFLFGSTGLQILQTNLESVNVLPISVPELNDLINTYSVALDANHVLWVSTWDGRLYSLNSHNNKLVRHQFSRRLTGSNQDRIVLTPLIKSAPEGSAKGGVIAGFQSGELYQVNHSAVKAVPLPELKNAPHPDHIKFMLQTSEDYLWLATKGSGLYRVSLKDFTARQFEAKNNLVGGLSSNNLDVLFLDNQDGLWASAGNGINYAKIQDNRFFQLGGYNAYTIPLGSHLIFPVLLAPNGKIWVGSQDAGLSLLTPGTEIDQKQPGDSKRFNANPPFSLVKYTDPPNISNLALDAHNRLWVGTRDSLYWLDAQTGEYLKVAKEWNIASQGGVSSMMLFKDDKLLINYDSLLTFQGKEGIFFHYQFPIRHLHKNSFSIAGPVNGVYLLASTSSHTIYQFNSRAKTISTFKVFTKDGFPAHKIFSLWLSPTNELWIGTNGEGIIRKNLVTGSVSWLDKDSGLIDNKIYGLQGDNQEYVWATTNKGLSRIDQKSRLIQNFTVQDGLQSNEFNHHSVFRSPDGLLFFGGVNGVTVIDENDFTLKQHNLKTHIQNVSLFTNDGLRRLKVSQGALEDLNYRSNSLRFKIGAVDLLNAEGIRYSYRLLGYDTNWTELGSNRDITFLNLPPGEYNLQVTSCNNENSCNLEPTSVSFYIPAPPWLSLNAYILYALVLLVCMTYFVKRLRGKLLYQKQRAEKEKNIADELRELNALKDQFLANTSHELRTPLNGIIGLSEVLQLEQKNTSAQESLIAIHECGRQLKLLVDDLLDFSQLQNRRLSLKCKSFDIIELVKQIVLLLQPQVTERKLQIDMVYKEHQINVYADVNRIRQVLHNLINNAIKFSDQGVIKIILSRESNQVRVSVSDEGIGISAEFQHKIFLSFTQLDGTNTRSIGGIGLGLAISKDIIELHGSELSVESQLGIGSKFSFKLAAATSGFAEIPLGS